MIRIAGESLKKIISQDFFFFTIIIDDEKSFLKNIFSANKTFFLKFIYVDDKKNLSAIRELNERRLYKCAVYRRMRGEYIAQNLT